MPTTTRNLFLKLGLFLFITGAAVFAVPLSLKHGRNTVVSGGVDIQVLKTDPRIRYRSYQMFQRPPEELSEDNLQTVMMWCKMAVLLIKEDAYTDEECRYIVENFADFVPDNKYGPYREVYKKCKDRLHQ